MLNTQIQFDFDTTHFYNTVNVVGFDLQKFEKRAKSLEYFILAKIFKKGKEYSPYDVLDACKALNYPTKENSVRRALFNLQTSKWEGAIVLTGNKVLNLKYSDVENKTYKLK